VKDPGPNVLEQQIETNALLTAILAASGGAAPGLPGTYNPDPIIYPVIFYDNGDGTFNYQITADGADYVAAYATQAAFVGINGMHLKTRVTTPAADDEVVCQCRPGRCVETIANLKVMFRCTEGAVASLIDIRLGYCEIGTLHYGHLEAQFQAHVIGYFSKDNGVNTWHEIGDTYFRSDAELWHIAEISIDMATSKYRSVRINDHVVDLPTTNLAEENMVKPHSMFIELKLRALNAATHEVYLDQLLVTPT